MIIGSIPYEELPQTYGGTTVLMKSMLDFFKINDVNFNFLSTNVINGRFATIRNYINVILSFIKTVWRHDIIIVNSASKGAKYLSPILYVITKIAGKKFVFRMFGGNFIEIYNSSSKLESWIMNSTIFKSNLLLFETKDIINRLPPGIDKKKVEWLPNVRRDQQLFKERNFSKKFVFIGHVKKTKGILDILSAASQLNKNYSFDIYGPITDPEITIETFNDSPVDYRGVLKPSEVIKTLNNYDILLLPSYHPGEGHPGIIIEALSLGIPVIATKWKAIPEVVENRYNGFLVPIKSPNDILRAMLFFNDENYLEFSENAKSSFQKFNEEEVYQILLEKIYAVI